MSFGDTALAPELPKAEVGRNPRPFAGEIAAGFAPGAGLADAAGVFPSFTNEEQQYYDGLITNVQNGQYGIAAMQGLAMLGDAMWAGGPLAGAVGTVGKMPLALSRALARHNKKFQDWHTHGTLSGKSKTGKTEPYFVDADGHPEVLVHGTQTPTDFDVPQTRRSEMGWHLDYKSRQIGDQALDFISVNRGSDARRVLSPYNYDDFGRLMPVYTNVSNPIRLPDIGGWSADKSNIYRALSEYDEQAFSPMEIIKRMERSQEDIDIHGNLRYDVLSEAVRIMKKSPQLAQRQSPASMYYSVDDLPTALTGGKYSLNEFIDGYRQVFGDEATDQMLTMAIVNNARGIPNRELTTAAIQRTLEDNGFDAIVYYNRAEGLPDDAILRIQNETGQSTRWTDMDDWTWEGAVQEVLGIDPPEALIVFHPTQVKSAVGNTGEYSRTVDSIVDSTGDRFAGYAHPERVPETTSQLDEMLFNQGKSATVPTTPVAKATAPLPVEVGFPQTGKAFKGHKVKEYLEHGGENLKGNIMHFKANRDAPGNVKDFYPEGTYLITEVNMSPNDGTVVVRVKNLQTGEPSSLPSDIFLQDNMFDVLAVYPKGNPQYKQQYEMYNKLLGDHAPPKTVQDLIDTF